MSVVCAAIKGGEIVIAADTMTKCGALNLSAEFEQGMADALYMEDLDEDTDHSEVEHLKDDVQDYGMCEHSPLVLDLDRARTPGQKRAEAVSVTQPDGNPGDDAEAARQDEG